MERSEIRGTFFNYSPGFRSAIAPALLYLLHPCSRALHPGYMIFKAFSLPADTWSQADFFLK